MNTAEIIDKLESRFVKIKSDPSLFVTFIMFVFSIIKLDNNTFIVLFRFIRSELVIVRDDKNMLKSVS